MVKVGYALAFYFLNSSCVLVGRKIAEKGVQSLSLLPTVAKTYRIGLVVRSLNTAGRMYSLAQVAKVRRLLFG